MVLDLIANIAQTVGILLSWWISLKFILTSVRREWACFYGLWRWVWLKFILPAYAKSGTVIEVLRRWTSLKSILPACAKSGPVPYFCEEWRWIYLKFVCSVRKEWACALLLWRMKMYLSQICLHQLTRLIACCCKDGPVNLLSQEHKCTQKYSEEVDFTMSKSLLLQSLRRKYENSNQNKDTKLMVHNSKLKKEATEYWGELSWEGTNLIGPCS